ncbi:MAG: hypothetical protein BWY82_01989 [Verrucomicrobia bacterium ADurb.Bin474]|nr:MAG: hypothetical protein BWY82_01989 [Verrucomicrobia bacterium ADurb.Bin474]
MLRIVCVKRGNPRKKRRRAGEVKLRHLVFKCFSECSEGGLISDRSSGFFVVATIPSLEFPIEWGEAVLEQGVFH